MLHVHVPIDIGTATTAHSPVFALATPMRVRDLLELGVVQALGKRAPLDRRERHLATALDGFMLRQYALDIDGHVYNDLDTYILCSGVVTLRFFAVQSKRFSALE